MANSLHKNLFSTSLTTIVEQPITRVLLAQQTKTVPGNAFRVAIKLSSHNYLHLWKALDAALLVRLAKLLVESSLVRSHVSEIFYPLVSSLLTIPFETVLTRLSTDPEMNQENFITVFWKIIESEGVFGLFHGFVMRTLDLFITHWLNSTLRSFLESTFGQSNDDFIELTSNVTCGMIMYPLRVLVRHSQARTAWIAQLRREGLLSLYAGLPLYTLHVCLQHYGNRFFLQYYHPRKKTSTEHTHKIVRYWPF